MKVFLLFATTVVALAVASDSYEKSSRKDDYNPSYVYRGRYSGKCGYDGLYYRNEKSFVFCSNGNSYVQPCAPGTKNSAYGKYSSGGHYSYRDFCDVNLVDFGYGIRKSYSPVKKDDYTPKKVDYSPKKDDYSEPKKDAYHADEYDDRRYGYGYNRRDYGYGYDRRDYGYGYDRYYDGYDRYGRFDRYGRNDYYGPRYGPYRYGGFRLHRREY